MKTILFLGVFITFTRCTEHKHEKVEDHINITIQTGSR